MEQQQLDFTQTRFAGSDYVAERDMVRMSDAMGRVFAVMVPDPGRWFTLKELASAARVPLSSVGSYLCYLRRDYSYQVPKRHIERGLFEYQLGRKFNAAELQEREIKRLDPIGDKEKFGEMLRSIYAYAHKDSMENYADMTAALRVWAEDFAAVIRERKDV